jgi:RNA polymerase sigma-70 factor (ECF subfamily)
MEQEEWKKIYQLYFKPLYLYALSLTHNTQDAEDLLQETFVKAFLSYKSTGSIKTWLIIVLKHEFLNVCRKRKREVLNGDDVYDKESILTNPDIVISDILKKEEKRRLFNSIQKLPELQRDILIESIYFELSDGEMAAAHGITQAYVRKLRSRAKMKLIEILKEEE